MIDYDVRAAVAALSERIHAMEVRLANAHQPPFINFVTEQTLDDHSAPMEKDGITCLTARRSTTPSKNDKRGF